MLRESCINAWTDYMHIRNYVFWVVETWIYKPVLLLISPTQKENDFLYTILHTLFPLSMLMMLWTAGKPMQYFILKHLFIYVSNDKRSTPKFLGQSSKLCDGEVFRKTSPLMSPGSSTVTEKCLKHKIRSVFITMYMYVI